MTYLIVIYFRMAHEKGFEKFAFKLIQEAVNAKVPKTNLFIPILQRYIRYSVILNTSLIIINFLVNSKENNIKRNC